MAIEFQVDTLDGVEQSLQAAYEESEGKYIFNPDKYAEMKGAGIKKNATELKKEKDRLKAELEAVKGKYSDFDDDSLTAFKEWREKQQAGEGNGKEGKTADPDLVAKWSQERELALKKQAEKFGAELAAKDKAISEMDSKFKSFVTKTTLTTLALKAGVIPDRVDSWLKTHADRFQLDGEGNLIPLDDEGDPSDVKAEKFIAEKLKEATPWFYAAVEQGGSGSGGANGKAGPSFGLKRSAMTSDQKAEYIRKYGGEAYDKLPLK